MKVQRALISVSDKTGLIDFVKALQKMNIEIIATNGTAKFLSKAKIKVTKIESLTSFPEILDGRVKTLHPVIHAGILAKREKKHLRELEKLKIKPIDLVVVNFYPFEKKIKEKIKAKELIEFIDIGGPTLVRAAAKNHAFVGVITNPKQYNLIINELKENNLELSFKTKQLLAFEAFSLTAQFDALIASFFRKNISEKFFPEKMTLTFNKVKDLRYGENPHQKAALYSELNLIDLSLLNAKIIQGKEMSFNNYFDADIAINIIAEFNLPSVAIIKHGIPCGVAVNKDINIAFDLALESDKVSAFGGIIALNRKCTQILAKKISSFFNEIIIAPAFEKKALEILAKKPNLRVIELKALSKPKEKEFFDFKKINSGLLLQEKDNEIEELKNFKCVTKRKPTKKELKELSFAWKVAKHVRSNAIVLAKNNATIGIGAGQTSRIDSLEIAIKKAKNKTKNAVLASDGFFPFRDSIDAAALAGITAIIQPGGSIKDSEVIKAANEKNITMLFTGKRHFKH